MRFLGESGETGLLQVFHYRLYEALSFDSMSVEQKQLAALPVSIYLSAGVAFCRGRKKNFSAFLMIADETCQMMYMKQQLHER